MRCFAIRRQPTAWSFTLFAGMLFAGMLFTNTVDAQQSAPEAAPAPEEPQLSPASDEAEKSLQGFRLPPGFKGSVFAAEPLVGNPVAFTIDGRGRVFVCESYRQEKGIEDNRNHGHWLDDDQAARTVEDRLRYLQKHLGDKLISYTRHDDRIRLLLDTDGDGKADSASVFANGFNGIVDGTGAGVLVHRNQVYYTCIPSLWMLGDEDHDGRADSKKAMQSGYGVRYALRGHDLHGLTVGPDGRIYFSIGDRGFHVETEGRVWANPECGAVFRCEPDGSHFEVFAYGLRNPQELAFDDHGNLFTCDNNSDSGDQARWTCIVEGGDTGWRMSYQYHPERGTFNREKIWHPFHNDQPAYIVPPIVNMASGPSGLAFYPGTGLNDHFRDRFLLCDFRGSPGGSGIRSFRVREKGAFFEVVDAEETFWKILATDVEFGPDGAVYASDWVDGWTGLNKGRIYRFSVPETENDPLVKEVRALLAEDLGKRSREELKKLIAHPDRRIRQAAQFALVDQQAVAELREVASSTGLETRARLHAIWGLGQLSRGQSVAAKPSAAALAPLLTDDDAEVRAQTARVLGDIPETAPFDSLLRCLTDDAARVRYFASVSIGKMQRREAIGPLMAILAANDNQDPILRHGAIVGMARAAGWSLSTPLENSSNAGNRSGSSRQEVIAAIAESVRNPSSAVRLGAVVALRKLRAPQVAGFLQDGDERVVAEAVRAIHDEPIAEAMPMLAAMNPAGTASDAILRRVLHANMRLGDADAATRICKILARTEVTEAIRVETLGWLSNWDKPTKRDLILHIWSPLEPRDKATIIAALRPVLPALLSQPGKVPLEAARLAAQLGIGEVGPALREILADPSQSPRMRADALAALATLKDGQLDGLIAASLQDPKPIVRATARRLLSESKPADALPLLEQALQSEERIERQSAYAALGKINGEAADALLARQLDLLLDGKVPADSQLDLLDATAARKTEQLEQKRNAYESRRPADDPLAAFRETLAGGDAERGEQIFFERAEVYCVRCHRVNGRGGDVGPELSKIGAEKKRDYLLESIVTPNKQIAKNFESVLIVDDQGQVFSGIVKAENDQQLQLVTAEAKLVTIPKSKIEERREGKSAMPEDLVKKLSKRELRDLIEYLSSRTGQESGGTGQ